MGLAVRPILIVFTIKCRLLSLLRPDELLIAKLYQLIG